MRTVVKDVLYPGTYHLPDGRVWKCSDHDVRNAVVNGNRMLAVGNVAAPVIWEHDIKSNPVPFEALLSALGTKRREWRAGFAKHTFGYARRYWIEHRGGKPVAFAELAVEDEKAANQMKNTRFVSPRINRDYTDFHGRTFPGLSIGHVAATPHPVQDQQLPVMLGGIAPGPGRSRSSVFLSLDFLEGKQMADDTDKGGKKGEPDAGGDSGAMNRILGALANLGVIVPEGVQLDDLGSLALVLETVAANKAAPTNPDPDMGTIDDGDGDGPGDSAVTPAMLSGLTGVAATAVLETVKQGRADLSTRLRTVERKAVETGLLTVPEVKKMYAAFSGMTDAVLLSVMGNGGQKNAAVMRLEMVERHLKVQPSKAKAGKNREPVNLSGADAIKRPNLGMGEPDADEIERAKQDAISRNSNAPKKPGGERIDGKK